MPPKIVNELSPMTIFSGTPGIGAGNMLKSMMKCLLQRGHLILDRGFQQYMQQ